ncbi:hypothetical protein ACFL0V_07345, partial [Nanoarchaeota archaeon]
MRQVNLAITSESEIEKICRRPGYTQDQVALAAQKISEFMEDPMSSLGSSKIRVDLQQESIDDDNIWKKMFDRIYARASEEKTRLSDALEERVGGTSIEYIPLDRIGAYVPASLPSTLV